MEGTRPRVLCPGVVPNEPDPVSITVKHGVERTEKNLAKGPAGVVVWANADDAIFCTL